ncbi:sulfurtransferase TusA family protein [Kaarinaea lacus]
MSTYSLDARRLLCPLPVIRSQDKVNTLAKGDILEVFCTDPGATNDIPAWCRINGHKVVGIENDDNEIKITIEVCGLDA